MKVLAVLLISLLSIAPDSEAVQSQNVGNSQSPVKDAIRPCNSIPVVSIDYKTLIKLSPFVNMRGMTSQFNCSRDVYVGPAAGFDDYVGTVITIAQNTTLTIDLQLVDNKLFRVTICSTGEEAVYQAVYETLSSGRSSVCYVSCANNGTDYHDVICSGRTADDAKDIDGFLSTVSVPPIFNFQLGCPKSKHCHQFN